jgi:hypothetical protein
MLGLHSSDSGLERMAGFCEHGKEILGTVHGGFLHWLKNCQLLKKDPAPRSSPINRSEMNLRALPVFVSLSLHGPFLVRIWPVVFPNLRLWVSQWASGSGFAGETQTPPLTRHVHRLCPSASSIRIFTCQKLTNNLHRFTLLPKYMRFLGFSKCNPLQHSGYYMYHLL